nr:hypothetical protein [uncultured Rhodopila sp.]
MLRESSDPAERHLLEELLAEERAKLNRADTAGITEPAAIF